MAWEVEFTDQFEGWWLGLSEGEQESVHAVVGLLERNGPMLRHPHSSGIKGSKYGHLRELRIQYAGEPYRVFYAFDPRRVALLLIGGCKAGDEGFYNRMVPIADRLYEERLEELRGEGLL